MSTDTGVDGTLNTQGPAATPLAPPPTAPRPHSWPPRSAAIIGPCWLAGLGRPRRTEVLVARHSISAGRDRGRRPRTRAPQCRPGPQTGRRLGLTKSSANAQPWTSPRADADTGSFTTEVVPGEGESVVGVALTPQAPGLDLQYGDRSASCNPGTGRRPARRRTAHQRRHSRRRPHLR